MKSDIRVLLIEDEEADYFLIKKYLSKAKHSHFELEWRETYEEALQLLLHNDYDICLTDYQLGAGTGLDLIRRALEWERDIPFIILTGHRDPEIDERSIKLGAEGFLPKEEITPSLLERIIRHTIKRKQAESALRESEERYRSLSEYSSATLHNMGNVLNSVNVTREQLSSRFDGSRISSLFKVRKMLEDHLGEPEFFSTNDKGRQLPKFLIGLANILEKERQAHFKDLLSLERSVELMDNIISAQQARAKQSFKVEQFPLEDLVREAIDINNNRLHENQSGVTTRFEEELMVAVERVKLIHVLINLIKNAIEAINHYPGSSREIRVTTQRSATKQASISITDTGSGILRENLEKLFTHGFTTKTDGHGFGLHHCSKVIGEMKGTITADSDGDGRGATFTVMLPCSK